MSIRTEVITRTDGQDENIKQPRKILTKGVNKEFQPLEV